MGRTRQSGMETSKHLVMKKIDIHKTKSGIKEKIQDHLYARMEKEQAILQAKMMMIMKKRKGPKAYGKKIGERTISVSMRLPELDYNECCSFHDECNRGFSMSYFYISLIKAALHILKDEETPIPESYVELTHLRAIHELKRKEARRQIKITENLKDEDHLEEFKELRKKFEELEAKVIECQKD